MKRSELSPADRVQYDIQQYVIRRARMTRIRAQELMEEAEAFEHEVHRLRRENESERRFG